MTVTLSPNPSHLEYVNPVIEGRARADQTSRKARELAHDPAAVVPVLIHGDAAFPGQGMVAETLNLQALPGYSTGGTIHLIANNQLGFTTDPDESRSTRYASDLAKGFDMPIIHVNADDVEACIAAVAARARLPRDLRPRRADRPDRLPPLRPQRDRRARLHAAADVRADQEPPARAQAVRRPARGARAWSPQEEAERMASEAYERVAEAHAELKESIGAPARHRRARARPHDEPRAAHDGARGHAALARRAAAAACPTASASTASCKPLLERRREAFEEAAPIDWAHAESLAFASLLALGVPVRLTGQDTERGTFSQRHAGAARRRRPASATAPLQHLRDANAPFELHNSPLSEQACLGFEYGYSVQAPDALVLWEAQFGDFVNSAQVIIDQFLVSGLAKWGQTSRLTPAAAARLRGLGARALERARRALPPGGAEGNIRVANCTTPAQYFHLLRRQALVSKPRPLVVMTPEEPAAAAGGHVARSRSSPRARFQRVIDDPRFAAGGREQVTKLVLCSGKVYYDIAGPRGARRGRATSRSRAWSCSTRSRRTSCAS